MGEEGRGAPASHERETTDDDAHAPRSEGESRPRDHEFGREGWLLVAGIVVAFLVVPALIYLNARNVVALPFRFTFLALPLVPAILLAILAVWVTATR